MEPSADRRDGDGALEDVGYDPKNYDPEVLDRTKLRISELGFSIDGDLWGAPDSDVATVAAKCQHGKDDGPIIVQPKPKPTD
ncbi:hypothetical protein [Streptomyces violaceusniger]|uniref:Uncharacterized protein n=1 Tax=Streptomyces violaceusniger (strain Tu 4113) TaxID=653045 RepID=G2NZB9_STRV4|nr:hypothetical protein [Streptomyces violaceusniger]AEM83162.1 hypothetical protein Strvi_3489 [Streptomyces violaceusniger Tu 4113]